MKNRTAGCRIVANNATRLPRRLVFSSNIQFFRERTGKVERPGGTEQQSMMSATIAEKRISYVACRRCGRIYGTAEHKACPDCLGRRRAIFTGFPSNYPEENPAVSASSDPRRFTRASP
jgi:hypothetical protein